MTKRYWCFRVDRLNVKPLNREAHNGRLRQGWGFDVGQDLRNMTVNKGASRNRRMLTVKKDDIILVPNLPNHGMITIMRAAENWGDFYHFSILDETKDHGHIFPVEVIRTIKKNNDAVPAAIRDTFRSSCRFWNVDRLKDEIEEIMQLDQAEEACTPAIERWRTLAEDALSKCRYSEFLQSSINKSFSKADWEYLIADALEIVYPGWKSRRVGGRAEAIHGTDILLTTPAPCADHMLGIAVQVKDYTGKIGKHPIHQVLKAQSNYWDDVRIVEYVIAIVGGEPEDNESFIKLAEAENVRILWASEIQDLMLQASLMLAANPETHSSR